MHITIIASCDTHIIYHIGLKYIVLLSNNIPAPWLRVKSVQGESTPNHHRLRRL